VFIVLRCSEDPNDYFAFLKKRRGRVFLEIFKTLTPVLRPHYTLTLNFPMIGIPIECQHSPTRRIHRPVFLTTLCSLILLTANPLSPDLGVSPVLAAAELPQEIPLPPQSARPVSRDLLQETARIVRGPKTTASLEARLLEPPEFFRYPGQGEIPEALSSFLNEILIPTEALYFQPGTGLDAKTGLPYDHIRIRLDENMLGEVGHYTAASKLSLSISFLLKIIQRKKGFQKLSITPNEARRLLNLCLHVLRVYQKKYPEQAGFFPWVDIRPNGTIAPANTKIPSLDNGQMTWALAAIVAAFEKAADHSDRELASEAQTLLDAQDYRKFYDPEKGLLHGTIQLDSETGQWTGDRTYYLNDMFEGTLAVLWGVLHGQIPEKVWQNLRTPTTEYLTRQGEKITVLKGFRASFHESWALAFIPFMESALAPLYQNYLYAQADHAHRLGLPGFSSTGYDPKGIYRQMGLPLIAGEAVDREDVAVFFATAMGMLVNPTVGAVWLERFYQVPNMVTPFGAVESVGHDGYADIFTADAKGMTLLSASGGVLGEIKDYLHRRTVPHSDVPMDVKLAELLHSKYRQILEERKGAPLYFPTQPFPTPASGTFEIHFQKPPDPGPVFNITEHLQSGHLHGKNVYSIGRPTMEMDIAPGKPFAFYYNIPAYSSYFDQWAFRGTYIDRAVRIADMRYISLTLPVRSSPSVFEVELKSDDITLATVVVNNMQPGILSGDGLFKTFILPIKPVPESDDKPLNYISVVLHDPRYLLNAMVRGGREGEIRLEKILLTRDHPLQKGAAPPGENISGRPEEFEVIRYWRLSHGSIPFIKNPGKGSYRFSGGQGWRGGYIPYTNLNKFNYIYLRARNVSGRNNIFFIEFKYEDNQLLTTKVPVVLGTDSDWSVFEIKIPKDTKQTFNYLAVSDAAGEFELSSVLLTQEPLNDPTLKKTTLTKHLRTIHPR